jgi:hypothetical protein
VLKLGRPEWIELRAATPSECGPPSKPIFAQFAGRQATEVALDHLLRELEGDVIQLQGDRLTPSLKDCVALTTYVPIPKHL